MKWVRLTRLDGKTLWVASKQVVTVSDVLPAATDNNPQAKSELMLSNGKSWIVREPLNDVMDLL